MRISNNEILFDQPDSFQHFVRDLELIGQVRFSQPILDDSGSVMIREKIFVKQSLLERLSERSGQYKLPIAVEATDELIAKIRNDVTKRIQKHLDHPGNAFLRRLYSGLDRNHRPFVVHSFRDRTLALLAYRLEREKPDLFEHLSILGLTCLGIVLQQNVSIPLIHRHAFLAGFTAMIGLADIENWQYKPEQDAERKRLWERGAAFIDQTGFVQGLGNILRDSYISATDPPVAGDLLVGVPATAAGESPAPATPANDSDGEELSDADALKTVEKVHPEAVPVLIESLRLARFAHEMIVHSKNRAGALRELIQQMAYNSGKGYFSKRLVSATVDRFQEFEKDVRFIEAMARVEAMCLHGDHAAAYPKPRATQVLCGGNVLSCPYLQSGWNFHLVAPLKAYGRIGKDLPAGTYHKCSLEDGLPPIPVETATTKRKSKTMEPELPASSGTGLSTSRS